MTTGDSGLPHGDAPSPHAANDAAQGAHGAAPAPPPPPPPRLQAPGPIAWDGTPLPGAPTTGVPMPGVPMQFGLEYYPLPLAPQGPRPPRVWSAILVPIIAIATAATVAGVGITVFAIAELGAQGIVDQDRYLAWVESFGATPGGLTLLVLPGQLTFLGAALVAAWLSPKPLVRRLGLNRPTTPWLALPLLLLATPFAGCCGDLLMQLLFGDEIGEHLDMLYKLFRTPTGWFLVLAVVLVGVTPASAKSCSSAATRSAGCSSAGTPPPRSD